jgi:hypothetical protein
VSEKAFHINLRDSFDGGTFRNIRSDIGNLNRLRKKAARPYGECVRKDTDNRLRCTHHGPMDCGIATTGPWLRDGLSSLHLTVPTVQSCENEVLGTSRARQGESSREPKIMMISTRKKAVLNGSQGIS